ncbi:hypothetical protein D3C81_2143360 [compost metagenome]
MRADFIDDDQLWLAIIEMLDQLLRRRHVSVAYTDSVKLDEPVDVLLLGLGHQVLQFATGALGIDVDRLQPGLFRVLRD